MTTPSNASPAPKAGRNDPCPCGSGKKFKRCCGFNEQPSAVSGPVSETPADGPQDSIPGVPGFDPSQLDPEWLAKMSQAFQRLPKGQMQRLQAVMQKAMAGKDVGREAEQLEKSLPVELQGLLNAAPIPEQPETAEGGDDAESASKLGKAWRKMFKKRR